MYLAMLPLALSIDLGFGDPQKLLGMLLVSFVAPLVTQLLKRYPVLDRYATVVNGLVAVLLYVAGWAVLSRDPAMLAEFIAWALAAGGLGTAGYNAVRGT